MPQRSASTLAAGTLLGIAATQLIVELVAINQYGYFRDELYYMASTAHLDWGFVDHPPLSIAVLALVRGMSGDSLVAVRSLPAALGAVIVLLTGRLASQLGGGRFAQALAALCVATSPIFLATAHYYSMNVFDQLFWVLVASLLVAALNRGGPADWTLVGVVVGLGLLNKISMLWCCGGIAAGLLFTPYRRVLRGPWPWVAALIAAVIASPYLVWQVRHGWPTLEFMRNATTLKMHTVSPVGFVRDQILGMNAATAPVWIAGIASGLIGSSKRPAAVLVWMYLAVFALLIVSASSRASYLAVAYPAVLAAGAVALEHALTARRAWLRPALTTVIVATGLIALPLAVPLLPVPTFVRYQNTLGQAPRTEERHTMGPLPQQYADMFGWQELTDLVAQAYERLTPDERQRCRVFGQNYGEAGAIDVLGRRRGLPPALSGHNSYWLWGPGEGDVDILIIIGGEREDNAKFFNEIEIVGQTRSPWAMPYENGLDVSIARAPKVSLRDAWPKLKLYI